MSCCLLDETIDNIANAKRARTLSHQLKKFLRLFRKRSTYKTYPQPEPQSHPADDDEINDNLANEALENRLLEEMASCEDFAAISVHHEGQTDLLQVFRGQKYIPVHFAKTAAGTFFWTSMLGADRDLGEAGDDSRFFSQFQQPQLQVASDRWAQA